jgi:hypothetical protein
MTINFIDPESLIDNMLLDPLNAHAVTTPYGVFMSTEVDLAKLAWTTVHELEHWIEISTLGVTNSLIID